MSLSAYQKTQNTTESPRETEYRLFAQVTQALMKASESEQRDQPFFQALDWNRRLWSTLSSDCATEGNGLPKELRAQIVSLALWVSRYSSQVAQGREDIQPLIDINRTIMEGLGAQAENSQPEKEAPQAAPSFVSRSV